MGVPMLIMNVQVFSLGMDAYYLTSSEGVLKHNHHIEIKIPRLIANFINGGPIVGERYSVRYRDGIEADIYPLEIFYVGMMNEQLVFSSTAM